MCGWKGVPLGPDKKKPFSAQKIRIHRENFRVSSKIRETLLPMNLMQFCPYGIALGYGWAVLQF